MQAGSRTAKAPLASFGQFRPPSAAQLKYGDAGRDQLAPPLGIPRMHCRHIGRLKGIGQHAHRAGGVDGQQTIHGVCRNQVAGGIEIETEHASAGFGEH